jgi:hypothetical protein
MADTGAPITGTPEAGAESKSSGARGKDEIALDLMKFIAVATGYGKVPHVSTGFSAKPGNRSTEEHVEALLELFERCRKAVGKEG